MGVMFALLSAFFFGLNNATARRGVVTATAEQAILVTVPINAVIFFVIAFFFHQMSGWRELSYSDIGILACAGIINYVLARYCNYRSIKIIGAVRSGPILQVGMIVSVTAGIGFLDESLSIEQAGGIAFILLGLLLVMPRRGGMLRTVPPARNTEGYFFAILGSIGYGVAPVLIRIGCGGTSLGIFGGLMAFAGAQVLLLCILICARSQRRALRELDGASIKWLALTGLINGCAQVALFMGLAFAPVSLVVPIQRTSVVFRLLFSYLLNRNLENFERTVMMGSFISLAGALLLSI